jgi:hypothetical protein
MRVRADAAGVAMLFMLSGCGVADEVAAGPSRVASSAAGLSPRGSNTPAEPTPQAAAAYPPVPENWLAKLRNSGHPVQVLDPATEPPPVTVSTAAEI